MTQAHMLKCIDRRVTQLSPMPAITIAGRTAGHFVLFEVVERRLGIVEFTIVSEFLHGDINMCF
jgi:hypothetical protein